MFVNIYLVVLKKHVHQMERLPFCHSSLILGETCGFTGGYLDDSLNLEVLSTISGLIFTLHAHTGYKLGGCFKHFFSKIHPELGDSYLFFMVAPFVTS